MIPSVTNFDIQKVPVEGDPEFRENASYVWSKIPNVIADFNAAIEEMNSGVVVDANKVAEEIIRVKQVADNIIAVQNASLITGNLAALSTQDKIDFVASLNEVHSISQHASFKNKFINGDCRLWQRYVIPVAKVITVSETYVADRWAHSPAPGATLTVYSGRDSINLPYNSIVTGVVGTPTTTYNLILQKIENPYQFSGKSITFSFKCKITTGGTKELRMVVYNSATATVLGTKDIVATSVEDIYSYTLAIPDMSGDTIDNSDFLQAYVQDATDHKTFTASFKELQTELGNVDTEFEQVDQAINLMRCNRYLPYRSIVGDAFTLHGTGYCFAATTIFIKLDTKITSRAEASAVTYTGNLAVIGGGTVLPVTNLSVYAAGTDKEGITLLCTVASGGIVNDTYVLRNANDATAYIEISTEL